MRFWHMFKFVCYVRDFTQISQFFNLYKSHIKYAVQCLAYISSEGYIDKKKEWIDGRLVMKFNKISLNTFFNWKRLSIFSHMQNKLIIMQHQQPNVYCCCCWSVLFLFFMKNSLSVELTRSSIFNLVNI